MHRMVCKGFSFAHRLNSIYLRICYVNLCFCYADTQIHIENDHFLSARADKSICSADKTMSRCKKMGTRQIPPDTHSLETLLYFAPNSCQVVYVETFSRHHHCPPPQTHLNHFCFQLREVTLSPPPLVLLSLPELLMPLPPLLEDPHSFLSGGFKMTQNSACLLIFYMWTLVLISHSRMHLILLPLVLGHLNTTIYLVSFLMSVCCGYSNAYTKRSTWQITLIHSRTLRSHAGTNISCAVGVHKNKRMSYQAGIVLVIFVTGFACPWQRLRCSQIF